MAYGSRTTGYQYETSPRKLKPEYESPKKPYAKKKSSTLKQKKQKEKRKLKPRVKAVLYILVGFSILFTISYRNSLITESFNTKEELKEELSALQKENAQLEISIQNSLNLTNIESSATSLLGMQKLSDTQKIYVSLPEKDYVEPASEQVVVTEDTNWFQELINKIADLF